MAKSTLRRFFDKVSVNEKSGCWEWTAFITSSGYGQFKWNGKTGLAHRFGYEIFFDPIPDGLVIDHLCRNRRCVNPVHLEVVTTKENINRGENASKTHCPRGHEYDSVNTYFNNGRRNCRSCGRRRVNEYYRRKHLNPV